MAVLDRADEGEVTATMTPDELVAAEELLARERGRLTATEAGLAAELAAVVDASDRANLDDEHDPEGSTVGYERARVASLLDVVRSRRRDLAAAAERLRTGTYGRCASCGQPIGPERLSAYPTAVECVGCVTVHAQSTLPMSRPGWRPRRETR